MKSIIDIFILYNIFAIFGTASASCDDKWSVQLPSANVPLNNAFDATISGSGGQYKIDIQGNTGTITQGSRVTNVVIDSQIPWQQGGEGSETTNLYAFIGADSDGLMMGWAYCHGSVLTDVWLEDTTGQSDFTNPKVTGTCSISNSAQDATLTTAAQCYNIDAPDNYPAIKAKGLILNNGDTGEVSLAGATYDLLPFAFIDCDSCKSDIYTNGWYEIHAVMKSPSNVCMGIYYLPVQQTDAIQLNYINCFAQQLTDVSFVGTYTMNAPKVVASTTTSAAATSATSSSSSSASSSSGSSGAAASSSTSGSSSSGSSSAAGSSGSSGSGSTMATSTSATAGSSSPSNTASATDSAAVSSTNPASSTTAASGSSAASTLSMNNGLMLIVACVLAVGLF